MACFILQIKLQEPNRNIPVALLCRGFVQVWIHWWVRAEANRPSALGVWRRPILSCWPPSCQGYIYLKGNNWTLLQSYKRKRLAAWKCSCWFLVFPHTFNFTCHNLLYSEHILKIKFVQILFITWNNHIHTEGHIICKIKPKWVIFFLFFFSLKIFFRGFL